MTVRDDALQIWHVGLNAVKPGPLVRAAVLGLPADLQDDMRSAPRIMVVGGGKAAAGMASALEEALGSILQQDHNSRINQEPGLNLNQDLNQEVKSDLQPESIQGHDPHLGRVAGIVNVPEGVLGATRWIRLQPARPAGVNFPTATGVAGAEEMLALLASAGPNDVAICLISGGGSALLPAPVEGVSLEDKQAVTKLLHASGASIGEMNAVRKHLSRIKGGRLAEAFRGKWLISLIVSDVVGDPLDVIASGPTAPDSTTFADALAVLDRYQIRDHVPAAVAAHLARGAAGEYPETLKEQLPSVRNLVIGSNALALSAARREAEQRGYRVLDLGPFIEGETKDVAAVVAGIARNIQERGEPIARPACILLGGETTVSLGDSGGLGGRNQEFVLAAMIVLGADGLKEAAVLSGGTDGEDGPTDAAGAVATAETLRTAANLGLDPRQYLSAHDAYPYFDATGGLIRTGLTDTNVMDLRVVVLR